MNFLIHVIFGVCLSCISAKASDTLSQKLSQFDRVLLYTSNHNDTKLNNVHAGITASIAEITGKIIFSYETDYLNAALTNKLIEEDFGDSSLYQYMGSSFLLMDTIPRIRLYNSIKNRNTLLKGFDCAGSNLRALEILFDSTYQYFSENNISTNFLKHSEQFVKDIPNQVFMVLVSFSENDLENFENLYNQILLNVKSEFLLKSWKSIYQFFKWLRVKRHDEGFNSGDCQVDMDIFEYRDKIMFQNFLLDYLSEVKNIVWLGSSHSQRRLFDYNNRGKKFKSYPNSFADYLAEINDSKTTVSVFITHEQLDLPNANYFFDNIGGQSVKVYYVAHSGKKKRLFFKMGPFCSIPFKANWFKSFDYIVVTL